MVWQAASNEASEQAHDRLFGFVFLAISLSLVLLARWFNQSFILEYNHHHHISLYTNNTIQQRWVGLGLWGFGALVGQYTLVATVRGTSRRLLSLYPCSGASGGALACRVIGARAGAIRHAAGCVVRACSRR